jgi:hypothetical protein
MLIYNVFGRHIGVQRKHDRWLVFRADLTEKSFLDSMTSLFLTI